MPRISWAAAEPCQVYYFDYNPYSPPSPAPRDSTVPLTNVYCESHLVNAMDTYMS